jgi:hypothetical protein
MQAKQGLSAPESTSASTIGQQGRNRPARATITKQHFIAIARVLADHKDYGHGPDGIRRSIARDLASYFSAQNPLFDRARFLTAAKADGNGLPTVAQPDDRAARLATSLRAIDAALSQKATFPADVSYARKLARDAIALVGE